MFPFLPPPRRRTGAGLRVMQMMELEGMFESMALEQAVQHQVLNRGRMQGYAAAMRDMEGAG